jgi:hypothetical protein
MYFIDFGSGKLNPSEKDLREDQRQMEFLLHHEIKTIQEAFRANRKRALTAANFMDHPNPRDPTFPFFSKSTFVHQT